MKQNLPVTNVNKVLDNNDRLLSTTDLKGKVTYVNSAFIKTSEFSEDELIGLNHNTVRHPDMPPAAFESMWGAISTGKSWMGVVKNRCKSGDHYWVDAYVMPIQKDGVTTEYQSVRLKPDDGAVKRAETVYKKLLKGKKLPPKPLAKVSLKNKLIIANVLSSIPILSTLAVNTPDLFTLLAFPLSLTMIIISNTLLMKPFADVTKQAKKIYDNPLMSHIYTGREDEFGHIQLALKMQQSQIESVVGRLSDTTRVLSDISISSSSNSEQAHQGALAQHYELTQVASAMNSMAKKVQEVAANATKASDLTEAGVIEAKAGKQVVNTAINSINKLATDIQQASDVIKNLSEYSTNIGDILDVIKGIAEQTNLLALNAAIEAARAGEHGRGFAVVADEVRVLASRTQDSTLEIERVIAKLQAKVKQAVRVMDTSCKQADKSVHKAKKVDAALESVAKAINIVSELNQQIASSSEDQSVVAHKIDKSILNISDTANEASKGAQASVQSNDQMSESLQGLNNLITQFMSKDTLQTSQ